MDIFELFKKIETPSSAKSAEPITHMIVGLGNPGDKYKTTRHNIGFLSMYYLSKKIGKEINTSKFDALIGEAEIGGKRTLLVLPQTFMNNSGISVGKAASFYKIPPENVTVVFDDISLDVGKIRIRKKGSDGGHNGIKSIVAHLGSNAFPRVKIGVGAKPYPEMDLADWVLSNFGNDEMKTLEKRFDDVCEAVRLINSGEIDKAMNSFNG